MYYNSISDVTKKSNVLPKQVLGLMELYYESGNIFFDISEGVNRALQWKFIFS